MGTEILIEITTCAAYSDSLVIDNGLLSKPVPFGEVRAGDL